MLKSSRVARIACAFLVALSAMGQQQQSKKPDLSLPASSNVSQEVHVTALMIPPKNVYTIFGKAVGKQYAVVLVRVANKSSNYSLVTHDIYIDYSKWLLAGCMPERSLAATYGARQSRTSESQDSSRNASSMGNVLWEEYEAATNPCQVSTMELRTIRQVALQGQVGSPRNWTIRALHWLGSIGTGLTVAGGLGPVLPRAVDAFAGSAIPAIEFLWPDDMINKINLLNDLSYTINAVVPKNSSRDFMAFFPIRRFLGSFLYDRFINEPSLLFSPAQYRLDPKFDPFFQELDARVVKVVNDWNKLQQELRDAGVPIQTPQEAMRDAKTNALTLNNISLNSIRIVVNGQLLAETADVPASLSYFQFKNPDAFKGPGVVEGFIKGRFLTGGQLTIANAKDLGITVENVAEGSDDETLNFKLTLQHAIPLNTNIEFTVEKVDRDKKTLSSNVLTYQVHYLTGTPKITSLDPTTAGPGDRVAVTGSDFVYVPNESQLILHLAKDGTKFDIDAKDLSIDSPSHLTFKVPLTATDGTYQVTIENRVGVSGAKPLTVSAAACPAGPAAPGAPAAAPEILLVNPNSVKQGDSVSIRGHGFANLDTDEAITLTAGTTVTKIAKQNVTSTDECHISFKVPDSLAPGVYDLVVKSGAGSSAPAHLTVAAK